MASLIEQKIFKVLEPVALQLGYDIVKVSMQGSNRKTLDIYIDRVDQQPVTIKDCRSASNNFSAVLDVEDVIKDRYYLGVSSAGVERPLCKLSDYDRFLTRKVSLKTSAPVGASKKFTGDIAGRKDNVIDIKLDSGEVVKIEFENIKSANLVFTDEMFRESLAQKNKE